MGKKSKVKLRAGASIGQLAAEDDHLFLVDCFVEHPAVEALKNVASPQCLLLGRTGSGKSAIFWHLEATLPNVSRIEPKEVAFQYIGNSAIVRHLTDIGVDLHLLYEYLWTHILTLHFIRECLGVRSQDRLVSIVSSIRSMVRRDEKRALAISYLEKHADDFWLTVEQVSTEITDAISEKLASEVGLTAKVFKSKIESGDEWKDEQKRLFKHRAQEVVSRLQMRELKEAINALSECIDKKLHYFVLVDDLDKEWAGDEKTQYALIRALIESLKTFRRIPNLKILIAIREDLFEATLRTTTDKHFQAEKLDGIIKRLRWSDQALNAIVERRIQQLYRHGYTKQPVSLIDVFPMTIARESIRDYLIRHTLRRPRDIIAFVNKVLSQNEDEVLPLPSRAVTKAEPGHSNDRLRALEDEWRSCHPLVGTYLKSIQGQTGSSSVDSLDEDKLFTLVFEVDALERKPVDDVERLARAVYERDKHMRFKKLARTLTACLYKMGAVGLKLHTTQSYAFCYQERASIGDSEIGEGAKFVVHPMLAAALGCHEARQQAA
jgi:hypothetical protein